MITTPSKMAVLTGLVATMTASTDAYRITYRPAFPTRALRRSAPSALTRQSSYFPTDIGRMFDDVDELFDSMLGDVNSMFYDSSPFHRMSRPSYLLEAHAHKRPTNTYSITQDEKQVKMVVTLPGAKASDVKLDLDEDNRTLRISGKTKFLENEGISLHSRFDKSFTLDRNLDISGVAAEFDDGILTITAPKFEEIKDSVRTIDIVDNSSTDEEVNEVADTTEGDDITGTNTEVKAEAETSEQNKEEVKPESEHEHETDESLIDLDETSFP